eukprot:753370-Hanusia_phi.AAC.14
MDGWMKGWMKQKDRKLTCWQWDRRIFQVHPHMDPDETTRRVSNVGGTLSTLEEKQESRPAIIPHQFYLKLF